MCASPDEARPRLARFVQVEGGLPFRYCNLANLIRQTVLVPSAIMPTDPVNVKYFRHLELVVLALLMVSMSSCQW
jgi:hypothetical protein